VSEAAGPLLVAGATAFPEFSFRSVSRTSSTQDVVRAAARAGAGSGYLCVADEQSAGRGRQGRRWVAPAGSALLASILLRRRSTPEGVPLAAGLALGEVIGRLGVEARVKWPNDVLVGGAKLAGILAEVEPAAPGPETAVVLGVGVNLRVDSFPDGVVATSLHRHLDEGSMPSRDQLLAALLPELAGWLRLLDSGGIATLLPDWRRRAAGLGERVVAATPAGRVEGMALDVDADGALLVGTDAGVVRLLAGDVHIQPAAAGDGLPSPPPGDGAAPP
jgi:BirA family transcriptional regulator, biotin operon repressor / biotin---[acetyl-CoA-carboxylase] ligase